jgi:hypothetical protein
MEGSMNPMIRLVAPVAGLVLLMHVAPSWGQTPTCNPATSDANSNIAGGEDALSSVNQKGTGGFFNTAFGFHTLDLNSLGDSSASITADYAAEGVGGDARSRGAAVGRHLGVCPAFEMKR